MTEFNHLKTIDLAMSNDQTWRLSLVTDTHTGLCICAWDQGDHQQVCAQLGWRFIPTV